MSNKNKSGKPAKPMILIVDDVSKNIQLLGNILRKENYQISFATNGEQALSMIVDVNPDLILLDIMMPGMDGYEVCKRLKDNPKSAEIPVIFLTAKTETADVVKGFRLGAVDFVSKPFNSPELLARVKTHIQLKNAKEKLKKNAEQLKKKNKELEKSLLHIKRLEGLLPVCCNCKKIRLEESSPRNMKNWIEIEEYIADRTDAEFSHGICPDCAVKLYPDLYGKNKKNPGL